MDVLLDNQGSVGIYPVVSSKKELSLADITSKTPRVAALFHKLSSRRCTETAVSSSTQIPVSLLS
jgi:hypothetical protein